MNKKCKTAYRSDNPLHLTSLNDAAVDAGQGTRNTAEECNGHTRRSEYNSDAVLRRCSSLWTNSRAFTLFEVLISLAIFSLAVTGIVIALESMAQTCIDTRESVLSRLQLESRLAYNMVDPPLDGDRTVDNHHGVITTESFTPLSLNNAAHQEITGIYRLKITSQYGKTKNEAEILLYHP